MITSPLDLRRHLTEPEQRFDPIPLLDLILIGLFFVLLSSRFVFAPGLDVDLPEVGSEALSALPTAAVLTIRENEMILFGGDRLRLEELERRLRSFVGSEEIGETILLVKAHRKVEVQLLLEILDLARRSGFTRVQIAAEEKPEEAEFLSTKGK